MSSAVIKVAALEPISSELNWNGFGKRLFRLLAHGLQNTSAELAIPGIDQTG